MEEAVKRIQEGGAGVVPTDTLYGIVASAFDRAAVERIYELKGRDETKPFIVLVGDIGELEHFGAELDEGVRGFLVENWPAPLSVILPVAGEGCEYLHRGSRSLAFRRPLDERLQALLRETGPLVAPSANPQGAKPAATITEAKGYFGDRLDFYVDGGELRGEPSTLVRLQGGEVEILRVGACRFDGPLRKVLG